MLVTATLGCISVILVFLRSIPLHNGLRVDHSIDNIQLAAFAPIHGSLSLALLLTLLRFGALT